MYRLYFWHITCFCIRVIPLHMPPSLCTLSFCSHVLERSEMPYPVWAERPTWTRSYLYLQSSGYGLIAGVVVLCQSHCALFVSALSSTSVVVSCGLAALSIQRRSAKSWGSSLSFLPMMWVLTVVRCHLILGIASFIKYVSITRVVAIETTHASLSALCIFTAGMSIYVGIC